MLKIIVRIIKKVIISLLPGLLAISVFGQENSGLKKSLSAITNANEGLQVEKLYLQFDKQHYIEADTIRFKAYLMNNELTPSTKSGILYIAMNNTDNRVVKQIAIPLVSGIGWGNIPLDDIRTGNYTLRAFTNWMLNFGEDRLFKKIIYIAPLNSETIFINAAYKLENTGNRDKVTAGLQLTGLNGQPLRLKDIWIRLGTNYRWLYNNKVNTGMDGRMHFDFKLADKTATKNLYINLQQIDKGADTTSFIVPVNINRPENIDMQFMPEGGNIVAGISQKIAFKAINEDGTGAGIKGKIYDNNQQEITEFQSTRKGMGSFEFTPREGTTYTAKTTLPNNTTISYKLPQVKATGTTLKVVPKGKDSLEITLSATPNLLNKPGSDSQTGYYLVGQTGGIIYYAAGINLKKPAIKILVAKDLFPAGITHFTLFNNNNQPLNERIYYIAHKEVLQMSLTTDKLNYTVRDSIAVAITAKDKDGKPIEGSFSLAVTDDSQVNTDSTKNIISHLLLTSDLKGAVEEPAWYFEKETPDRETALDNLLLTQGWIGYNWKTIFNSTIAQPKHLAEQEFVVQGKLTNFLNKPLKNQTITLLQKKPFLIMERLTDEHGVFVFKNKNLLPSDSTYYMIQVTHKNGTNKDFNVGLEVDVPAVPVFPRSTEQVIPWYFNTDTALLNNTSTKIAQDQAEADYRGEGHMLKTVIINEAKTIPNSLNMNGPGGSDRSMNEVDLNLEKSRTLLDLLLHKYRDFQVIGKEERATYFLGGKGVKFFIDGVPTTLSLGALNVLLDWYTASDIKGIEVMTSEKMTYEYNMYIFTHFGSLFFPDFTYLEITTYSGVGPFFKHKAGRYVYKPLALTSPKAFYSPKYNLKNSGIAMGTHLRSTIHWEPGIVTDKEGKATVTFFSADKPANYTLILEGTDLNGSFGYSRQKIKVAPKTTAAK